MMRRDALQVVLGLRRHSQEIEERRLADIVRDRRACDAELERIASELEQITATRLRHIEQIQDAFQHQQCDSAMRRLIERRGEMLARINEIERRRVEQMRVYVSARREREVIDEVHGKREALREAQRRAREQKRVEELFIVRRVRQSDRSAAEIS